VSYFGWNNHISFDTTGTHWVAEDELALTIGRPIRLARAKRICMKSVGIIGGIGPQSTMDYYKFIIAEWRNRTQDGSYPSIIINSIDPTKLLGLIGSQRFPEAADYLLTELRRLANAGVDFGVLSANGAHVVFDVLRDKSPIPLISIVEATCQETISCGLKRVGLFGAKFVMQGGFYFDIFIQEPNAAVETHDCYEFLIDLARNLPVPTSVFTAAIFARAERTAATKCRLRLDGHTRSAEEPCKWERLQGSHARRPRR